MSAMWFQGGGHNGNFKSCILYIKNVEKSFKLCYFPRNAIPWPDGLAFKINAYCSGLVNCHFQHDQ